MLFRSLVLHANFLAWVHAAVVSSMQYTHYTPEMVPHVFAETLQIFSMKLKLKDDNPGGFEFPLSVYGMVAVRDALDSRRNILFSRSVIGAQVLTQDVRTILSCRR